MIGISDILAGQGHGISDWTKILGPIAMMVLYGVVWAINKVVEQSNKKQAEDEADETPPPPPHSPLKTSPTNRAVPLKREQPTLSNTLGRIAGQITSQADPQAPRPVGPSAQPAPMAKRMPLPPRQVPQPRPQPARASSASSGPVAFSQPRPQASQVAHAPQRQAPIPHAQPKPQPVAAVAKQTPKPAPVQSPSKLPVATQHPAGAQQHKAEPPAAAPDPAHFLGSFLGDRDNIRHAIILSEILARPVSLRHDGPDSY
jgi:hypothetical protein